MNKYYESKEFFYPFGIIWRSFGRLYMVHLLSNVWCVTHLVAMEEDKSSVFVNVI